jgi:hypothetical protein
MKMLVILKLMSIPIVPVIIAGKTNAQYGGFAGIMAKSSGAIIHDTPAISMRIVPESK